MTAPYYSDSLVTLYRGDCIEVMRSLPDNSVHAVVTDPPYGLGFMGKEWDDLPPGLDFAVEALRVLKPGGYMLAFGGSRTWHRLAVAVEDAGFEIRDSIAWLYGSGFPKSLDVSKAIDKAAGHWRGKAGDVTSENSSMTGANYERTEKGDPVTAAAAAAGWGTALKPAFEPIIVGRKPFKGTVAGNVMEHGTGALNIDGCRIATDDDNGRVRTRNVGMPGDDRTEAGKGAMYAPGSRFVSEGNSAGRWPTNVVLEQSQADALDAQTGIIASGVMRAGQARAPRDGVIYGKLEGDTTSRDTYGDSGGASRFFPTFRYEAKAPGTERPDVDGMQHPTVKPLDLMRWLVRLVTPPNGIVLEPFAGSGTTLEAALIEGFEVIGIEREADYLPLIMQRITKPLQQSLFGDLA